MDSNRSLSNRMSHMEMGSFAASASIGLLDSTKLLRPSFQSYKLRLPESDVHGINKYGINDIGIQII